MATATSTESAALAARLRGELIGADDASYDEARKLYNAMIDKRPRLIARCVDAGDVVAALACARGRGLEVAVRCGAHNGGGLGSVDDGLVIDLSAMRGVSVDPERRTAQVLGGSLLGDVDHATHAFGLAAPFGIIGTTGVGGLTLGGGIGHLTRKLGLSINNLLAADVVLADGTFVTASEDQHEDLFWALRGGGGNFGAVNSFTFKLSPISTIVGGPTLFAFERSAEILSWYREFIPNAPDELNGFFAFLTVPPADPFPEELRMKKVCGIVWCYAGPPEQADEALRPIRALRPDLDLRREDAGAGAAVRVRWPLPARRPVVLARGLRAGDLGRRGAGARRARLAAADLEVDHAPVPDRRGRREGRRRRHAVGLPGREVGAGHRRRRPRSGQPALKQWTVDYFDALHPHSMGGAYVNFMMDEGQERVRATYRGNYARLAEIKRKYDPTNLFHINQNIRP